VYGSVDDVDLHHGGHSIVLLAVSNLKKIEARASTHIVSN
jgi:hypothetical protein